MKFNFANKILKKKFYIDSRLVTENSVFLCIKGPNNDGHKYAKLILNRFKRTIIICEKNSIYSKNLKNKHNEYFEKYIYSLVLNQNVKSAIQEIKIHKNTKKTNFFASYLLLAVDSMQKKNYQESNFYLDKLSRFRNIGTFETIIYESLKNYVYAFENKKIIEKKSSYQNLSNLHKAFINCYLNSNETNKSFEILINSEKVDYSRYLFFYITYLIENNKIIDAKNLINEFDEFNSILLVLQSKIWLEKNELNNFTKIFSCKNENDLLAEFFFLIANLYSTQEDLETSNFYLSLAEYLNEKFRSKKSNY